MSDTPMIRQYLSIKEKHADAILFYRMGDFYEMFFEDAQIASQVLEITLTSRNKREDTPIPMCGIPVRAVQTYVAKLLENGYKVAICEQIQDAAVAKGIVDRDVVRVITPGMIVEGEFLDEKSNNFLLAIARLTSRIGIAWLDISTGTFRVSETENPEHHILPAIIEEILRGDPREVLLPESARSDSFFSPLFNTFNQKTITFAEERYFDPMLGYERLTEQFNTLSLEGFGCEDWKAGISAAGALLLYVRETQKQKVTHISRIETYILNHYMVVDDTSARNLELLKNLRTGTKQGTLLSVIDKTVTSMGGRLLKEWLRYPLTDVQAIQARLDGVSEARERLYTAREIRERLKSVYDLERLGSKISMGHANARDLIALKRSLQMLPEIAELLKNFQSACFQWHSDVSETSLDTVGHKLADLIERAIREDAPPTISEGGMIRTGFHSELDELIQISSDGKGWIARLEGKEKEATGINAVKVRFNKVFGYYIEIPRSRSKDVPAHYVRKQTLVNAERYITDELKNFETKVLGAEERRAALEYEIFNDIRKEVMAHHAEIQEVARFLAQSDVLINFAEIAEQYNYIRPVISSKGEMQIEAGRHPVIEQMIAGERFVPNSISMDNQKEQILVITGPNMAGKSTILRQVALITLMAHMGAFVSAKKATIGLTDRIFTRVGALDNLSQGQSTFMVEMQETANILNNATVKSLIILDEIGRGTSTFDGLSIAWAVAEYLHDLKGKGVKTLFATHYHELTELERTKRRVKNYNIAVKEWKEDIIFLRKLVPGGTNRSYGIQVARLAGIPDAVIRRAKQFLADIEKRNQKNSGETSDLFSSSDDPLFSDNRICETTKPLQMDLFGNANNAITEELQNLDISAMTPLEALNYLSALQERVKQLN